MSSDYTKIMLKTLQQHPRCDINLTFYTKEKYALLSVSRNGQSFEITHLVTQEMERFEDIDSTASAIENTIEKHDII